MPVNLSSAAIGKISNQRWQTQHNRFDHQTFLTELRDAGLLVVCERNMLGLGGMMLAQKTLRL